MDNLICNARQYLRPEDVDCVGYHFPCSDGFGAFFAARYHLGHSIKYIPFGNSL